MKKNIAVIFGGRSAEHDVSIITAHIPIIEALQATGAYAIHPIYITRGGLWYSDPVLLEMVFFREQDIEQRLQERMRIKLFFDNGLDIVWSGLRQRSVRIDVAFPAMHGTYGEDGSLMGLLRMAGVPFVGCDLAASAVCMDKVLTKQVLSAEQVPVAPYVWFTHAEWERNSPELEGRIAALRFPVFVKPVHLGSSIAISKISDPKNIPNAVELALHYDTKVLVEESVENLTEVTLPIMGNDSLVLGQIEQPLHKKDFFDFNDKYIGSNSVKVPGTGSAYSNIPAAISAGVAERVQSLGKRVYKILGCSGTARIDFLIDNNEQKVFVNEVNTLPGSLYHHNWRAGGVSSAELVTTLIRLAEEKHKAESNVVYTFNSPILKKGFGSKLSSSPKA